jgi:hypothetical protein
MKRDDSVNENATANNKTSKFEEELTLHRVRS